MDGDELECSGPACGGIDGSAASGRADSTSSSADCTNRISGSIVGSTSGHHRNHVSVANCCAGCGTSVDPRAHARDRDGDNARFKRACDRGKT